MRARALLLAALAVAIGCGPRAWAQTVTGTLSGRVVDSSGAIMPGVKIQVKNEQTDLGREAVTNAEGYYQIPFLPLGSYQVSASLSGFQMVEKTGVVIELNRNTVSDFALQPSRLASSVKVTGEAPLIERTVGEVKFSLDSQQIEDTPLPGRNFMSLVEQIPGFQNALLDRFLEQSHELDGLLRRVQRHRKPPSHVSS